MFTGLIEGQGRVLKIERLAEQARFRIQALFAWDRPSVGESVAVNGVCLSVEEFHANGEFSAYASARTMSDTSLGAFSGGAPVNLERALRLGDRLGGHLVSGHVDVVAQVAAIRQSGESRLVRLNFASDLRGQLVVKGSIALDGISLTINACGPDWLEVNVIPETWKVTTVANWRPGAKVNLETDLIGKYVENILLGRSNKVSDGISLDFLRENGFYQG